MVPESPFSRLPVPHVMPHSLVKPLAEVLRANLLIMHKKEGLIDEDFIRMIMKWRHTSGFKTSILAVWGREKKQILITKFNSINP